MTDIKNHEPAIFFRNTIFGPVAVLWSVFKGQAKVSRVLTPKPEMTAKQMAAASYSKCRMASCSPINTLANHIEAFLAGEDVPFSLKMMRLDLCTPFQQKVLRAMHGIPRGRISSYGLIAKYLNNPGASRAVGTALATNLFPIIIPCHRAVRSNGHLGGFQGGLPMKQTLLEMEGVTFRDATHVVIKNFFYMKKHGFA